MRLVVLLAALYMSGSGVSSFGMTPAIRTAAVPRQSASLQVFNPPSSSAPKRIASAVAVARGRRRSSKLTGGERLQQRCGAQAGSSVGEEIGVSLVAEQGGRGPMSLQAAKRRPWLAFNSWNER